MGLKVIGSGFGRTGTMSTKLALEQLGFGPCHHMIEVMQNPAQPALWKAVAAGEKVDWSELFDGYGSQVDWPGAAVWRESAIAFPNAKVVHTERPDDIWWASFSVTIAKFFNRLADLPVPPEVASTFQTMRHLFMKDQFGEPVERDRAIAAYRRNNQRVRDTVPADRLLVFDVAQGWGPLCRFLEVPEPKAPFPSTHHRQEFWAHFGGEPG